MLASGAVLAAPARGWRRFADAPQGTVEVPCKKVETALGRGARILPELIHSQTGGFTTVAS